MPSPLGHGLASLAMCAYRSDVRSFRLVLCAMVAGLAPDIDILFSIAITGDPLALHHLYTHNVFFPMLVALPLSLISGKNLRSWFFFTGLGWIHCLFDALIGWPLGSSPTRGIPFLFPISQDFIPGIVALFPPLYFGEEHSVWDLRNGFALAYELGLFILANLFIWIRRLLGYNRRVINQKKSR